MTRVNGHPEECRCEPCAKYRHAICWIAEEDGPGAGDALEDLATLATVVLVADLWDFTPEEVAHDVLRVRRENALDESTDFMLVVTHALDCDLDEDCSCDPVREIHPRDTFED